MITPDYCLHMARYNHWQNSEMTTALSGMSDQARNLDRGAFFGSIQATISHILWGDTIWISRFDGGEGTNLAIADSPTITPDYADWLEKRAAMDRRLLDWAGQLRQSDLDGVLNWFSGAAGRDVSQPVAVCLMQMFNHQTHHRGQVHAMVTAAGGKGWTTDLPFMPERFTEI